MAAVITRTGKGAAITQAENDANLDSLCGVNEPQTGTTYTIDAADQNGTIEFLNASPVAVTLTLIATIIAANDTSDFQITLKNIGAGAVTVTPTTDTFDDGSTTKVLAQYEWITIQTDSTLALWNIVGSSDASKVDGLDASQFLRSDIDDTIVGALTVNKQNATIIAKGTGTGAASVQYISFRDTAGTQLALIGNDSGANSKVSIINTVSGENILVTTNGTADIILTSTNINLAGQMQLNGTDVTASAIEINYNDITTLGTVEASKTVTTDASSNITGVNQLTVDTTTATTANGDLDLARNGTGDITIDTVPIYGLVILDTPVSLLNSTTNGAWTLIDMSAVYAPAATAGATKAVIQVTSLANNSSATTSTSAKTYIRKTGSGLAISDQTLVVYAQTSWETSGNNHPARSVNMTTVNLDSNSDLDWYAELVVGSVVTTNVQIIGYYV